MHINNRRIKKKNMYKKIALLLALLASLALAACGGGPGGGPGDESGGGDGELADQLSVYNWADYIDEQILADYEFPRKTALIIGSEREGLSAEALELAHDEHGPEDLRQLLEHGARDLGHLFPLQARIGRRDDRYPTPRILRRTSP